MEASIGFKLLKAQKNMDLQTEDLKKNQNTNQSFWLIGQPDVRLHEITEGEHKGKVQIEVMGFDYFNPKKGNIESGGKKNIAMWLLDIDYDGRSLFPQQVFFPMAGTKDGWSKECLLVPTGRPLADFLPTLTINANNFATELTGHNVVQKNLPGDKSISKEHIDNNLAVRKMLLERGVKPENLPPAEDEK